MEHINFAIIGCGRIAQRHAEQINKVGILKAVCDIDFKKAFDLASRYNATPYQFLDEMLAKEKGVCVVSVCTPNGLHAEHSIEALNSGFHVLCEKPMANKLNDCRLMIEAAERARRQLIVVKQNRFNPPVVAVKTAIDKGILGKIYSIQLNCFWNRNAAYYEDSWRGTTDLDGGTLYTQFSHFIDLLYWIVGDIQQICALTDNFAHKGIIEFEDTGVVALKFDNGVLGTINYTVNSYNKNMEGSLTVFAEKGTVKIGGEYLNKLEYQNIEGFEFRDIPNGSNANNYGNYTGSMSNHDKVYKNLVDVLLNGCSVSANAYEGLKTVEIIEKIYQSSKQLCI